MPHDVAVTQLHTGLSGRARPEDVAETIRSLDIGLDRATRTQLESVAKWSLARRGYWTSMNDDFEQPQAATRQTAALTRLFALGPAGIDAGDPDELAALIATCAEALRMDLGHTDFLHDRLNREDRERLGLGDLSRRQYNKRFRAIVRAIERRDALVRALKRRRMTIIAHAGFVADIPFERAAADPAALAFVAYFSARRKLRREFSLSGRENPMDTLAADLLAHLESRPDTDWEMVALARPHPDVLGHLDAQTQGRLLGMHYQVMRETAQALEELWDENDIDRRRMIVRAGNDSSSWNTAAGAFNAARAGWVNLLAATRSLELLDVACPGKALRLMAADLVFWHRSSDGDLDPDTRIWGALALPWEVIDGRVTQTRADVERVCRRAGRRPITTGWTGPRAHGPLADFRPTPELVHGIEIADPAWALLLRRAGAFSGSPLREDMASDVVSGILGGVVVGSRSHRPPDDRDA